MDIPLPPEDGSEPPPLEEEQLEQKNKEFAMYDDFAKDLRVQCDELGEKLMTYKQHAKTARKKAQ